MSRCLGHLQAGGEEIRRPISSPPAPSVLDMQTILRYIAMPPFPFHPAFSNMSGRHKGFPFAEGQRKCYSQIASTAWPKDVGNIMIVGTAQLAGC